MSLRTQLAWVWATNSGPWSPAAAVANSMTVDQPNPHLDRVDSQPGVGDVEKRHGRQNSALDPVVGAQALHRAFQDQRRPGHGVEDLAVLAGCGDEAFGDLGVHIGECVGRLVHIVERGRCTDQLGGRMSRRANESMRNRSDRIERLLSDELRARRSEPDDRDVTTRHELSGTTELVTGSHLP